VGDGVRRPVARSRGFTLLELIAVVTVIAVFASLAIPSAVGQLRSRRVQEAARQIGLVYREARLRALGRGSAVLVRVTDGAVTVHEASVAGTGACANTNLPVSSCLTPAWGTQRVVGGFSLPTTGDSSHMNVAFSDSGGTALANLDICFTPMGRAFARNSTADPFAALTQTYTATVTRPGTRTRQVVLMPNGTARLN